MRPFACLAPLALIGACCMMPPAAGDDAETAEMTPACALVLKDASAWKDRMPGPQGSNGNLVVVLEVEDDGVSRRFESRGVGEDGTLTLDVVEWDQPAGIGKIVYRNKAIAPKRVEVFCDGEAVTSLEVMTVY